MIHPLHGLSYLAFITREVVKGTFTVAVDAFTPGSRVTPMIVELPLRCSTDAEVTLMASSITITPGTLTIGIAPATEQTPPTLYVHSMYGPSRDETLDGLRDMERRLLRMTRGTGGRS